MAQRDEERVRRIQNAIEEKAWDALICTLPSNVLLTSGYWPVTGTALAIVTREGAAGVVAPEDEVEFACNSWADSVVTFQAGSLHEITTTMDAVRGPLSDLRRRLGIARRAKIGCEGASFNPSSYASNFVYGASIHPLLLSVFPEAVLADATDCLARLRSVLTAREVGFVRQASGVARNAFLDAASKISPGLREFEVASLIRSGLADPQHERCDGFAYCMSGPNSAQAYAAFQQTRSRRIEPGDFALVHCNSYCGGFWTDITRTFSIGARNSEQAAIVDAVVQATRQAMAAIKPGVRASQVDTAAREIMSQHGFGKEFKHATGHGVGFAAINHNAQPRIHPLSDEVLEPGMVFNVEPAAYVEQKGGMRLCNMVAVTGNGAELLTDFQNESSELLLCQ